MNKYQTNIGLEIHVQLKTKSKMFCRCDNNTEGKGPNTVVCPVCMGFPGVLPVANREAIEWAIKTALALNCQVADEFKFDRKHYFYPDLPKNFQISQYDLPLSKNGWLEIEVEGRVNRIRIKRVHLEEDAGKLVHPEDQNYSLVDFNRSGTPLMEVVTEPEIRSSSEAKMFLQELRTLLRYLDVSDADMEKGQLRCDANISLRELKTLGTPVEIKNMNSFRAVERALLYEEKRQKELLKKGERVEKETRGWVEAKGVTKSLRGKEYAEDYRYFPEPDLAPFKFTKKEISQIKSEIPELPGEKRKRFVKKYKIGQDLANILVSERSLADYFEEVASKTNPQIAGNWIVHKRLGTQLEAFKLIEFVNLINRGQISGKMGKEIADLMIKTGKTASQVISKKGLKLISDREKLAKIISEVIEKNPQTVSDYKKGKVAALGFLIGQVMSKTAGQANPQLVNKILKDKLGGKGG